MIYIKCLKRVSEKANYSTIPAGQRSHSNVGLLAKLLFNFVCTVCKYEPRDILKCLLLNANQNRVSSPARYPCAIKSNVHKKHLIFQSHAHPFRRQTLSIGSVRQRSRQKTTDGSETSRQKGIKANLLIKNQR